jgi:hypothetical protein
LLLEQALELLLELGVLVGSAKSGVCGRRRWLDVALFRFAAHWVRAIARGGLTGWVGRRIAIVGRGSGIFASRIVCQVARLFLAGLVTRQLTLVLASRLQVLFNRRITVEGLGNFDEQFGGRTAIGNRLSVVAGLDPELQTISRAEIERREVEQMFGPQLPGRQFTREEDLVGERFPVLFELERKCSQQKVGVAGQQREGNPRVEWLDQVFRRIEQRDFGALVDQDRDGMDGGSGVGLARRGANLEAIEAGSGAIGTESQCPIPLDSVTRRNGHRKLFTRGTGDVGIADHQSGRLDRFGGDRVQNGAGPFQPLEHPALASLAGKSGVLGRQVVDCFNPRRRGLGHVQLVAGRDSVAGLELVFQVAQHPPARLSLDDSAEARLPRFDPCHFYGKVDQLAVGGGQLEQHPLNCRAADVGLDPHLLAGRHCGIAGGHVADERAGRHRGLAQREHGSLQRRERVFGAGEEIHREQGDQSEHQVSGPQQNPPVDCLVDIGLMKRQGRATFERSQHGMAGGF